MLNAELFILYIYYNYMYIMNNTYIDAKIILISNHPIKIDIRTYIYIER